MRSVSRAVTLMTGSAVYSVLQEREWSRSAGPPRPNAVNA